MIDTTWFYNTNLKQYPKLQKILLSDNKTKFKLESQLISGNVGVGKTHNAILLARDYILSQADWHYTLEPCFVTFNHYLGYINDYKFGNPEMKAEAYYKLRELENSKLLIIDDLHNNFLSDYQQKEANNHFLQLLSVIYDKSDDHILIVTSNNSKDELQKAYTDSVCSRLFGMCQYIEVTGKDKRNRSDLKSDQKNM